MAFLHLISLACKAQMTPKLCQSITLMFNNKVDSYLLMTLLTNDQHYQLVKDDKGYAAKRFMFPCLDTSVSLFSMI